VDQTAALLPFIVSGAGIVLVQDRYDTRSSFKPGSKTGKRSDEWWLEAAEKRDGPMTVVLSDSITGVKDSDCNSEFSQSGVICELDRFG